jgi:ATP-binding cassette subfamily B protein
MRNENTARYIYSFVIFPMGIVLAGCSSYSHFEPWKSGLREDLRWLPVTVIVQKDEAHCGPACLEMVSEYWGKRIDQKRFFALILAERDKKNRDIAGVRTDELAWAARKEGFDAFVVKGEIEDLEEQLAKGRPVIVARPVPEAPSDINPARWLYKQKDAHFQVLAGWNPKTQKFIIADPAKGWLEIPKKTFAIQWRYCHNTLLIIAGEIEG